MLETQRQSWDDLQNTIEKKRMRVFHAIASSKDGATLFELVKALDWPVNRISGRVTELSDKGMIFEQGTRINPESGKAGAVWKAKRRKK